MFVSERFFFHPTIHLPWYHQVLFTILLFFFFLMPSHIFILFETIFLFFSFLLSLSLFRCSCCPLLLSSSFQLFICLLPGCLFRLSNDKCVLRANIGKNKMWFELDGSMPLLLLLLLSHIMPNPLEFLIFFFCCLFVSFLFLHLVVFVIFLSPSLFLSLYRFPCNFVWSTYVSFDVCAKRFSAYYLDLIRNSYNILNSTKHICCGIELTQRCHSVHFPACIFYGSNLVHCVILFLFFTFSFFSPAPILLHFLFSFFAIFLFFASCIRFILFIFSILVDSRYYCYVRTRLFAPQFSCPFFYFFLYSFHLFLYRILTNKLNRAFSTFHQKRKRENGKNVFFSRFVSFLLCSCSCYCFVRIFFREKYFFFAFYNFLSGCIRCFGCVICSFCVFISSVM